MKKALITTLTTLAISMAAQAQNIAITGGTIYTQTKQGVIENGMLLLKDGKVEKVTDTIRVPDGYQTIDATGKVVTPGLVGAMTSLGLVEVESWAGVVDASVDKTQLSNTGLAFDVSYAINPDSTLLDVSRIEGVTSAATTISYTDYLFHGQGSVITLQGDEPVLRPRAFAVLDLTGHAAEQTGGSRAALWGTLNQLFSEAAQASKIPGPAQQWHGLTTRADLPALQNIINGKMPLILEADRKADILQILTFKQQYPDMRIVLMGAAEAWRVADKLAQNNVAVILNPEHNLPSSFEALGATLENAGRLEKAGVTVAIGMETHNIRLATQHAGNAVANGLSHEAGIASITSAPARILGMQDTIGALATGMRGDVVIWSGDPLEVTEYAEQVFINGEAIDMQSRQTLLRDRYKALYKQSDKPTSHYIIPAQ